MHDLVQASEQLRRCVKELGFYRALVNNFQQVEVDGETFLYFDQPRYDSFRKIVEELDVPIYFHPAALVGHWGEVFTKLYTDRKYLIGPPLSFANALSMHIVGIITNGILDRFPKVRLIVGHPGEHIPFDFWRTDYCIQDVKKLQAREVGDFICETEDIQYYSKNNICLTTTGHFHTTTLKYVCDYLGPERLLSSVDYPYEMTDRACNWYDGDAEAIKEALGGEKAYYDVGRENAKKLFELHKYHDLDA